MSVIFTMQTPWDTAPDNTSTYEIYKPDDQWIFGNGVDALQKYDLVDIQELEGDAPKGNIPIVYKNRLMIAGDPSFPHRIWYSHQYNAEGWTKNTNWFDIYPEDGGKINNLGIRNDELVIGKSNSKTYGWRIYDSGDPNDSRLRVIEDNKGPVSSRSALTVEDTRHILDRSQWFTVPRTQKGGLSYIIQEVISAIEDLEDVATGEYKGKIYASIGDVSFNAGGDISLTDAVLVYDTTNDAFYLRDNMKSRVFSKFIDDTGQERLYFGDNSGKVYKTEEGTKAGNTPINMVLRTKPYFIDQGKNISMRKVGIIMTEPDGTQVTARINTEEEFVRDLGTVNEEPIEWLDTDGEEGPMYQLQFTHSGDSARPALFGWILVWREQSRKDKKPYA